MSIYDKLRKLYEAQGHAVTRAQHGYLADALRIDQINDGLDHIASDVHTINAESDRVRRTPANVALASRPTASGSVQIREVPSDFEPEPREQVTDPQTDAMRAQQAKAFKQQAAAQAEMTEQQRQKAWKTFRADALAAQQRAKREELLNGDPAVIRPFIDYALPLSAPSWFGKRDGTVTYHAPIANPLPQRNRDGTITLRPRVEVKRAPVPKTPEKVFAEAAKS